MQSDRIIIRDLRVRGILGILAHERTEPQEILLNLIIHKDVRRAAISNDLSFSVDYAAVAERLVRRVEEGSDLLAETLAHDIARIVITEFGAERVLVRVEKTAAVSAACAVGVEIEREAAEFVGPAPG